MHQIVSNDHIINATLPIDKVKTFHKGDNIDIEFPKSFSQIINS